MMSLVFDPTMIWHKFQVRAGAVPFIGVLSFYAPLS